MPIQQRVMIGILCLCVIGAMLLNVSLGQEVTPEPPPEETESASDTIPEPTTQAFETYVVQPGDNLYRIALRFGTTTTALAELNGITNTSVISVGQELRIPGTDSGTAPPVVDDITTTTYTVQSGDTLFRIAVRFGTTVTTLRDLNGLANADVIVPGQVLQIPSEDDVIVEAPNQQPPANDTADEQETFIDPGPPEQTEEEQAVEQIAFTGDPGFAYGIEAFMLGQDINNLVNQMLQLDVAWVKVRVEWRDLEPIRGEIDFAELDAIVNLLDENGFDILLTVTNAPDWSRQVLDESMALNENAPPEDLMTFQTFIGILAERYVGQVDAYQIWDEPNLRRNWSCQINTGSESDPRLSTGICETSYIEMLRLAYDAINSVDDNALVITAGLAPTGFNDGINAIGDRVFLQGMYNEGVTEISDAIAAHPGGWANPPDALCCEASPGVDTHFENESFYFLETLQAYRDIMVQNGDTNTPLWVTRFGWGTSQDTEPPSQTNIFVTYTSLSEQAIYVPRGFVIGEELGYVGPMFIDNLNGCQGLTYRAEACYTALIAPDGTPRPIFNAVQMIDRDDVNTSNEGD